jgi:RNA polymerase sigma factor (sigma-70 family)
MVVPRRQNDVAGWGGCNYKIPVFFCFSPILSMKLTQLIENCSQETQKYLQNNFYDDSYCFKLFEIAILENNQTAWDALFTQYYKLVVSWVYQHSQFRDLQEDADTFVNAAFLRFWKSLSSKGLADFKTSGQLLVYLKSCVHSAISDEVRSRRRQEIKAAMRVDDQTTQLAPSVEEMLGSQTRIQTLEWQIKQLLKDKQETIVGSAVLFYGLKPRQIQATYPEYFPSVQDVYRVKRNIFNRLLHNPEINRLCFESDQ